MRGMQVQVLARVCQTDQEGTPPPLTSPLNAGDLAALHPPFQTVLVRTTQPDHVGQTYPAVFIDLAPVQVKRSRFQTALQFFCGKGRTEGAIHAL